jgi:hypothetical protein
MDEVMIQVCIMRMRNSDSLGCKPGRDAGVDVVLSIKSSPLQLTRFVKGLGEHLRTYITRLCKRYRSYRGTFNGLNLGLYSILANHWLKVIL